MLNNQDLETLKSSLPKDWVEKVREETKYSASRIRQALNFPNKYNKLIINAAIKVAKDYKESEILELEIQKASIQELAS